MRGDHTYSRRSTSGSGTAASRIPNRRCRRRSGRSSDALLAYEEARRRDADAMGADPGPALRSLHAACANPVSGSGPPATGCRPRPFCRRATRRGGSGGPPVVQQTD
ncbi:BTAD domain-containing putative transcriptional regulator [Streptomyces sp. NPDC002577]